MKDDKDNGYKVSVIVPVYGVEKYIERCARSLFEQTLDAIEYIFINDCTKDNSLVILNKVIEEYPSRKPDIRIVNMPQNSGQAAVRNLGISLANGKYTIHCDSDDWIAHNMYDRMYNEAVLHNADVVVCDYYDSDGNINRPLKAFPLCKYATPRELLDWHCAGQLWNKLYKTSIYKTPSIILPQDNMGEDMALVYQMAYFCKKVIYIHECLYYFFCNPSSITHDHSEDKVEKNYKQTCRNAKIVEEFYKKHEYSTEIIKQLERIKNDERNKILPLLKNDKKYYMIWKNTFPELNSSILFNPYFSIKDKLKFILTYLRLFT